VLEAARNPHQARDAMFQLVRTIVRYSAWSARVPVAGSERWRARRVAQLLRKLYRRPLSDAEWLALATGVTRVWVDRRERYPIPELVDAFTRSSGDRPHVERCSRCRESGEVSRPRVADGAARAQARRRCRSCSPASRSSSSTRSS